MFGFPVNLQDSGVQKFTNDADNGFPKIQQREIFYSVRSGLWSDLNVWQTASGRVGNLPSINDDVYVRHTIDAHPINTPTQQINIFNLIVTTEGKLINGPSSGYPFRVYGNFKYYGIYDSSTPGSWDLFGVNNYIDKSKQVTKINVNYSRFGDQNMMDALYGNISAVGSGFKYSTSDMIVDNMFSNTNAACFYIRNPHSLICNGTFNCFLFYSDTEYNLTFKNTVNSLYAFFCSRNPTIEFQNNITLSMGNYAGAIIDKIPFTSSQLVLPFPYGQFQSMYLGTGVVKFTTNNIQINNTGTIYLDNNFLIDPNIVVTNNTGSNMYIHGTWNGSNGASQLINKGGIYFNSLASISSMTTGIWDFTTNANTIGYSGNYTATIPSYFTTFHNLTISGTGTKSLGVNTTLNGNLSVTTNGVFECGSFNLIVNGTSTLSNGTNTTYPLMKSGAGSLTFVGQVVSGNGVYFMDLSGGNPSVEMRGGMQPVNTDQTRFKSGTGTWTFTTNNQSLSILGGGFVYFNGAVRIGAGLTLSVTDPGGGGNNTNKQIVINSTQGIDGLSATSQLIISNNTGISIKNFGTTLMSTGIFNPGTNSGSMFEIGFNGNYTLPYTTFGDLWINNTSGIKSLSGNTTINNFKYQTQFNGQFQCSTFNLTINGTTSIYNNNSSVNNYAFLKSGAGSILFTGLVTFENNSDYHMDLSGGNPSVELRGGILVWNIGTAPLKSGSGTWTFSTNNQAFTQINNTQSQSLKFDCPILIDGAITLSQINQSYIPFLITFANTINGNNANSKFAMGSVSTGTNTCVYNAATQPMATGILDTSTNLNTWIYGSGNQDIKGGPTTGAKQVYRNLTLNGGGTKTLQGYVSVQNTYTLTSPATLNNNGFTLTNP